MLRTKMRCSTSFVTYSRPSARNCRLYTDEVLWTRMSSRSRAHVTEHFSPYEHQTAVAAMERFLEGRPPLSKGDAWLIIESYV